jgi:hypothetical protein
MANESKSPTKTNSRTKDGQFKKGYLLNNPGGFYVAAQEAPSGTS